MMEQIKLIQGESYILDKYDKSPMLVELLEVFGGLYAKVKSKCNGQEFEVMKHRLSEQEK